MMSALENDEWVFVWIEISLSQHGTSIQACGSHKFLPPEQIIPLTKHSQRVVTLCVLYVLTPAAML